MGVKMFSSKRIASAVLLTGILTIAAVGIAGLRAPSSSAEPVSEPVLKGEIEKSQARNVGDVSFTKGIYIEAANQSQVAVIIVRSERVGNSGYDFTETKFRDTNIGLTYYNGGTRYEGEVQAKGTIAQLNRALNSLFIRAGNSGKYKINIQLLKEEQQLDFYSNNLIEYKSASLSQPAAKSAAEASTLYGSRGYLASTEVGGFANLYSELSQRVAWVNGTDAGQEGQWQWQSGPYDGHVFWQGGASGSSPQRYTPWATGQPDDTDHTQNCAVIGENSSDVRAMSDRDCGSTAVQGYYVEYGARGSKPNIPTKSQIVTIQGDEDGVSEAEERGAPNNGDANHDGYLDAYSPNVASFKNPATGKYMSIQVPYECVITKAAARKESDLARKDSGFDYPLGLSDFTARCETQGLYADIKQYFYGTNDDGLSVRKYNPTTQAYFAVPSTTTKDNVDGERYITVSYAIKDGNFLDDDGLSNGSISDPVGLARKAVGVPNTGLRR